MKKTLLFTAILFIMAVGVFAGQPMTPGGFIDVGLARPSSMGGAFTAIADDASAVFYNPAGIVNSNFKDFTFMYTKYKNIVPYNYLAAIYPINDNRGVGLGVIVSGDKLFDEKTILLSYSEKLDWLIGQFGIKGLCLGANVKFQFAGYGNETDETPDSVHGSSGGVGLDLGILYAINPEVQVGAFVRDALSAIWWNSAMDTASTSYFQGAGLTTDLGMRYKIKDFMAAMTVTDLDKIKFGFEKTFFYYIDVRGGFSQMLDFESYKEYMVGLGIGHFVFGQRKEFSMNLDFAYLFERLDNTFKVQWSLKYK
jgi:hypothetical protein